jgi:hypothetical protein
VIALNRRLLATTALAVVLGIALFIVPIAGFLLSFAVFIGLAYVFRNG